MGQTVCCGRSRECEMYARELCKPLPSRGPGGPEAGRPRAEPLTFNSADEEAMVDDVFANAIGSLSEVLPWF